MKIAVNKCFNHGGFGLSEDVYKELGIEWDGYGYLSNAHFKMMGNDEHPFAYRTHPKLIAAIEKIGEEKSSGPHASIRIVEIPDDVNWEIEEYDGMETIHEVHRKW